ncbi:cytochrome d ubiquinol oxidase subunit II [Adlercreutzia caecimuris]|uniref:cytochrome d ubiquinol oxidase subunit II n=1 Tax=Adlercreutzia caecimuris TaxID=671266 RepID=UPI00258FD89C|nr:cytochrome d ubiquinol oxidase subunit II [Adlercreutzia caecimuris]
MFEFLSVLWFFLIFVLIAGYFVLDGFDLGVGVLSPFIARNDGERAVLRRAIGPVWDGNEVWLLTAGGALFAAFPNAYATTFSGFYLAVMLVLFGLIVRAVSFEFRAGDPGWTKLWDSCFFIGSLLPALLLGVAVGNIFAGIPMDEIGDYAGVPLLGLVTPFTLLTGLLGLAMFLAAGAAWTALKAPLGSELRARAVRLRVPLQVIALALFAVVSVYALAIVGTEMDPALSVLRWLFAALVVVGLAASVAVGRFRDDDLRAFLAQSAAMVALVALLACSMFPVLVNATPDSVGPAITIFNAASSELSLTWMSIILCIGLPLVLAYHVIIYRTFRGRVNSEDLTHY